MITLPPHPLAQDCHNIELHVSLTLSLLSCLFRRCVRFGRRHAVVAGDPMGYSGVGGCGGWAVARRHLRAGGRVPSSSRRSTKVRNMWRIRRFVACTMTCCEYGRDEIERKMLEFRAGVETVIERKMSEFWAGVETLFRGVLSEFGWLSRILRCLPF